MSGHHVSRRRKCREASFTSVLALALLASALVSDLPSAQAPPQVFRVSKDVVLVDVIATGPDGRPVTDLRADEFQLTEEGKPQRILDLRFVTGTVASRPAAGSPGAAPPDATESAPVAVAGAGEARAPGAPGEAAALVVVLDTQSMRPDLLARSRAAVAEVVAALAPATQLMLVTVDRGLVVRQQITTDSNAFLAAVDALAAVTDAEVFDLGGLVEQVDQLCGMAADGVDRMSARQQAIALGRQYLAETRIRMSAALDGLAALSRLLAPMPGRKHVVFYSTGYPTRPVDAVVELVGSLCGDPAGVSQSMTVTVDAPAWINAAVDDANRAQVSIYTVDPRGLVADNVQARQSRSARASRRGPMLEVRRQQTDVTQFLRGLAEDTGGFAGLNTNDATLGLRHAATDAGHYYLLAFEPRGSRRAGKYYRVGLETTRRDVSLRYRKGYLWLDGRQRGERDVLLATRFPSLFAEPPVELDVAVEGGRVKVAVIVPTAALRFTPAGDEQRNDLQVVALLRDAEGKVAGEKYLFAKDVVMKMTAERLAGMLTHDNIEIPGDGPAPRSGQYELIVVVRHSAGRISAKSVALAVP